MKPRRGILLRAEDEGYGPTCACSKPKSLTAAVCRECRDELRRGRAIYVDKQYSVALEQQWPIPVAFPPIVSQEPLVHTYSREEPA